MLELDKYKVNGRFSFKQGEILKDVCNAPRDGSGVYIVYISLTKEKEIVYIGSSGKIQNDGSMKTRKNGLYDRIVNGKQFSNVRYISWPIKMAKDSIQSLDVCWYITYTDDIGDIPAYVEAVLIQRFYGLHQRLPRWNNEF
jgi:hypothetical protein